MRETSLLEVSGSDTRTPTLYRDKRLQLVSASIPILFERLPTPPWDGFKRPPLVFT